MTYNATPRVLKETVDEIRDLGNVLSTAELSDTWQC
jgi:hypothetical protein